MIIKVYDKSNLTFKNPKELYKRFLEFSHQNAFNAEDTLDFTIPFIDYKTIDNEDFVEYDGVYFIVKTVEFVRDSTGRKVNVSCVHIKQLLLDKIVSVTEGETELFGKTVREVLERIIIGTPFTLGNIEDFGTWDIDLGDRTALECLNDVVENWKFENTEIIPSKNVLAITNLAVTNVDKEVGLTWTEDDPNWLGTKIVMNTERIPNNENDGTVILINNVRNKHKVNPFKKIIEYGKLHYFKAFPYNDENTYNRDGNVASITVQQPEIDTNPPDMVSNFNCLYDNASNSVKITFTETNIADYFQTVVCKKQGSMPTDVNDGVLFINIKKDKYKTIPFVDNKVEVGKTYYYRIFTADIDGNINTNSKTAAVSIPLPVVKDTVPPGSAIISNISYDVVDNNTKANVNINILDPADEDFAVTRVVRNYNHYPVNADDGVVVLTNTIRNQYSTNPFIDKIDYKSTNVYYKTFTVDNSGNVNNNSGVNHIELKLNRTLDSLVEAVSEASVTHKDSNLLIRWTDPTSYWSKTKIVVSYGSTTVKQAEFTTRNMYKNADYVVPVEFNKLYDVEFITFDINNNTNSYSTTYIINKQDIVPPDNISNLSVFASDGKVYVKYNDSVSLDWSKTVLLKKELEYPQNELDGVAVLTNKVRDQYSATPFVDSDVVQGKQYYYKFFTFDTSGNVNQDCDSFIIDIPIVQDTVPPSNPRNITLTTLGKTARITFQDPNDLDWAGTDIVCKVGSAPSNQRDGEVYSIYTRNKYTIEPYIYNIEFDKKYYFGIFPYDKSGNYNCNYANVVSVTISQSGENVAAPDNANLDVYSEDGVVKIKCIDPSDYNWVGTSVYRVEI